ncbi:MAG: FAD-binding oxidoreductase [Actinomycetota bacterium]|nr:FAD-binding oxidoreductase [Actinomycetota bacterium]
MSDYVEGKSRWWGWGDLDQRFDVENRENIMPFLRENLGMALDRDRFTDPQLEEIDLPPCRIGAELMRTLEELCGPENLSAGRFHRVSHSMGKSYRDLLRFRQRRVERPVDVVVWPREEGEVVALLRIAEENNLAVIPFGGGSSVTGGVEPLAEGKDGVISMDLARLNRVLRVDATSQTAVIQAGALGPEIEEQLNAHGYTLGHFPESFDHSSLGGWLATRASGRQSTGYGDIEDMVLALRMVTPRGVIDTRKVPSTAAGPSVLQLCVGSEGFFGVITEATMRVRPLPSVIDYRGLIFRNFAAGVSAIREMMQQGLVPTCVRLSDRTETALAQAFRSTTGSRWKRKAEDAALKVLASRGYSFDDGAFMVLGLEGERDEVEYLRVGILRLCRQLGGFHLGTSPGRQWYKSRHETAYFREQLINWGVMVDTLETATTWDNLLHLYGEVRSALRSALEEEGRKSMVACHVSHSYREGASLYYTFFAPMAEEGREEEQWEKAKRAASEAIMEYGGTISHHHGVGYEHAPWMRREVGDISLETIRAVKKTVDPAEIMNPGKLIPPQ